MFSDYLHSPRPLDSTRVSTTATDSANLDISSKEGAVIGAVLGNNNNNNNNLLYYSAQEYLVVKIGKMNTS
jgi:hypothetical protein